MLRRILGTNQNRHKDLKTYSIISANAQLIGIKKLIQNHLFPPTSWEVKFPFLIIKVDM